MTYNKNDIIRIMNEFPELKDTMYLLHGGSMVMFGIKELTNDIDVAIAGGFDISKYELADQKRLLNMFDLGMDKACARSNISYVIVDGIRCQQLEMIVKEKRMFAREKDMIAVAAISRFLRRTNVKFDVLEAVL